MSLKKTVAIAVAAGALAAISVPAMAFENEFHGLFNAKFYLSNIDNAGAGQYGPSAFNDSKKASNYFEQRARLQYIAKASDDLKLVTQFELDSTFGGNGNAGYKGMNSTAVAPAAANGGNNAGQLDADSITLETKHVYLDFKAGPTQVKVGIQPYADAFNGTLLIADLSAIATSTKLGGLTLGAAFARVGQTNNLIVGSTSNIKLYDLTYDIFALDTKYAVSKDMNVGFSYVMAANYTTANKQMLLHTAGLNTDAKFGSLALNGFVAKQFGYQAQSNPGNANATSINFHGMAMALNAKAAMGPGSLKTGLLFTTGDNDLNPTTGANTGAQRTGWRQIFGSANNQSGMMLLSRNDALEGLTTTNFLVIESGNGGKGQILYTLGYDATLSKKAYANANVGMAWVAKSAGAPTDAKTTKPNGCDLVGTELNVEAGYKLYDNLTVKAQAAYVILGGYYKGSAANSTLAATKDPENPYTIRTGLSFAF